MIPLRLYLYAGVAVVVALIGWRVNTWHNGYKERDQAVKALADYSKQVAERDKKAAEDKAAAEKRAEKLRHSVDDAQMLIEKLRKKPPNETVKYVQLPGESCPSLRLDPEFVRDWNAISAASALPDSG